MPENERRSVLNAQMGSDDWVIKHPDSSLLEFKNNAWLKLSESDDRFWELLVTKFTETHAEKYTIQQVLSEGLVLYTAGSSPVQVIIEGELASGKDLDYRVKFLNKYIMELRERRHTGGNTLQVKMRRTSFTMQIESFTMSERSEMSDFTTISISGVAHHFNTEDGVPLIYEYADFTEDEALPENKDEKSDGKGEVRIEKPGGKDKPV